MKRLWRLHQKKAWLVVLLIASVSAFAWVAGAGNYGAGNGKDGTERRAGRGVSLSRAVLAVQEMSCSGCVATIRSSLADIKGIREIRVDVAGGRAEIDYDPKVLKAPDQMAKAITAGGYPARLEKVLAPDQIRAEKDLAARMAVDYVAGTGDWKVSRADFESELGAAKRRFEKIHGPDFWKKSGARDYLDYIRIQIADRLIHEALIMQAVKKAGYDLAPEDLQNKLDLVAEEKGLSLAGLKRRLAEAGYPFEIFKQRVANRMLIQRFVKSELLSGADGEAEKQRIYASWVNDLKSESSIVYYDKRLRQAMQRRGGQGSCCEQAAAPRKN